MYASLHYKLEVNMGKKVVVGMSGGVDSSVAAFLLKNEGYDVIGVTMQIWQEEDEESMERQGGCCGLSAVEDARKVAEAIGIPYYVMNFREIFRKNVIDYFVREYENGRTPNPCIACNKYVKWEALLNKSLAFGADYIATGHYARIVQCENKRYAVKKSVTDKKDQTYALYNLTQNQLMHTMFPIGEYEKGRVREIAQQAGLPVAYKPDSQEICFVNDNDYAGFICNYTGRNDVPGKFTDMHGNVIGNHKGITHYTVGQRKGLGLSLKAPLYVNRLDVTNNAVILSDNEALFSDRLLAENINYMGITDFEDGMRANVKIRYNHKGSYASLYHIENGCVLCRFDEKVRAVTPGQAMVAYDDNGIVLLGGTIS